MELWLVEFCSSLVQAEGRKLVQSQKKFCTY
jgi:hypothetical protein